MNILLVEDDQALAKGLQHALTHEHFVVNWVANGNDALHVIATETPDIVILDMGLPDIDGLQVVNYSPLKGELAKAQLTRLSPAGLRYSCQGTSGV